MRINPLSLGSADPSSATFAGSIRSSERRSAHYKTRACEMKALAEEVHEPVARGELIALALGYEVLAANLRHRTGAK